MTKHEFNKEGVRDMTKVKIDKPWEHPERGDWCNVLHFMVNQIRAKKSQSQVIKDTSDYVDENNLDFIKSNIATYYPWLCREVKEENQE